MESLKELYLLHMDHICRLLMDEYHSLSDQKEWWEFTRTVLKYGWDPELYDTDLMGIVHSYIDYKEDCRWGRDPLSAIELLNSLNIVAKQFFAEWLEKYGKKFPRCMRYIYTTECLRMMCLSYANLLLNSKQDAGGSPT